MNRSQAIRTAQAALRDAGAVRIRSKGGHEVWRFKSGAIFPVQLHAGNEFTVRRVAVAIKRQQRAR